MPGWLKALLIVVSVMVVLGFSVAIGVVYWVSRNKDVWIQKGKAAVNEGGDFGRSTDNQGCVDESISRYKKEPGFTAAISTSLFMQGCLESSRPTPGFCDEVPKQTEIMKSAQWRVSQCRRVDLSSDRNCQNLFAPVQRFCEEKAGPSQHNRNLDDR